VEPHDRTGSGTRPGDQPGPPAARPSQWPEAHDDAINVHGTHLRIVERLVGRKVKVRFMHPQTFGFMAFNSGDEIEFVRSDSLATYGANRVSASLTG